MHLTHNIGGYVLLVLLAILAPTPIPIPLDGIVVGLIKVGFNPVMVLVVSGLGDVIGTTFIFWMGLKGREIFSRNNSKKRSQHIVADRLFSKYGQYSLLLSGIPFLGDTLIFLAGFYKIKTNRFFTWFLIGKAVWYLLLFILATNLGFFLK